MVCQKKSALGKLSIFDEKWAVRSIVKYDRIYYINSMEDLAKKYGYKFYNKTVDKYAYMEGPHGIICVDYEDKAKERYCIFVEGRIFKFCGKSLIELEDKINRIMTNYKLKEIENKLERIDGDF